MIRLMVTTLTAAVLPIQTSAFDLWGGGPRMSLKPAERGCFAIVEVVNTLGDYHEIERLETPEGFVSIEYETIGGNNAHDHDIITVRKLPEGVFADPMRMELPDDSTGEICLFTGVVS